MGTGLFLGAFGVGELDGAVGGEEIGFEEGVAAAQSGGGAVEEVGGAVADDEGAVGEVARFADVVPMYLKPFSICVSSLRREGV